MLNCILFRFYGDIFDVACHINIFSSGCRYIYECKNVEEKLPASVSLDWHLRNKAALRKKWISMDKRSLNDIEPFLLNIDTEETFWCELDKSAQLAAMEWINWGNFITSEIFFLKKEM